MHICGHVFMVSKYNLHAKHPKFTNLMDEYYCFKMQNCIENDEPLNAQPIPLKRVFFLFYSIECQPITNFF
jgi:hypothetical protein